MNFSKQLIINQEKKNKGVEYYFYPKIKQFVYQSAARYAVPLGINQALFYG
jgi:hypothetical protein